MAALECPSIRCTTSGLAPAWIASDAAVCRSACVDTRGNVGSAAWQTDTETAELQIALCANPKAQHRRRVWEAWTTKKGRTGRRGALRALNVEIRAAREPVSITQYAHPEKPVPVVNPGGRVQNWDPHDGDLPRNWTPVKVGWMDEPASRSGVV